MTKGETCVLCFFLAAAASSLELREPSKSGAAEARGTVTKRSSLRNLHSPGELQGAYTGHQA